MTDGATSSLRERKMQQTAARLTSVSRRLTAQGGLSSFTIEELCEEVGVSRRTFFNYFATKEDAVIGVNPEEESARFADEFLARGDRGWSVVLDDIVGLIGAHFDSADVDLQDHGDFMVALEREPRLLLRFVGVSREREREAQRLVARRQQVADDDPRAEAAIAILSTILRSAGDRLLDPRNPRSLSVLLADALAASREVLTPSTPRKALS